MLLYDVLITAIFFTVRLGLAHSCSLSPQSERLPHPQFRHGAGETYNEAVHARRFAARNPRNAPDAFAPRLRILRVHFGHQRRERYSQLSVKWRLSYGRCAPESCAAVRSGERTPRYAGFGLSDTLLRPVDCVCSRPTASVH